MIAEAHAQAKCSEGLHNDDRDEQGRKRVMQMRLSMQAGAQSQDTPPQALMPHLTTIIPMDKSADRQDRSFSQLPLQKLPFLL